MRTRTICQGVILGALMIAVTTGCTHRANSSETRLSGDAAAALTAGEYRRAIERAAQATQLDPTDPWPYYDRGFALVALGRTSEAIASFERAEALFGNDHWARSVSIFARARAYKLAGRCTDAARAFEEHAVMVQSTDAASAALARRYADECTPPVANLAQAERSGNAAMALAADDNARVALDWSDRAIAASPTDPWPLYDRGSALIALGRTHEAIAAFQRAEALFGEHPWGRWISAMGRARVYLLEGQCTDAIPISEQYARWVERNDRERAAMARRYAVECRSPGSISPLAPVSTQATQALISSSYERAVELADREAMEHPSDGWPYYHRATALVGLGRTDEAVTNFERAELLFGDNRWAHSISIFGRARAAELAGRCPEAGRGFEQYAQFVQPSDPQGAALARKYARECPAIRPAIGGGPSRRK